jgi:flagellar biosynthesis protein FliR
LVARSLPDLSLYFIAAIPLRALIALVGSLLCISLIIDMLPGTFIEALEAASAIIQRFTL